MQNTGSERRWLLLWLLMTSLVVYGSLYPFQWRPEPLPWQTLLVVPRHISRSDIIGNLALFIPYGFCGLLALRWPRPAALLAVLVTGLLLALALQVAQLWTMRRTAALYDAGWNGVGILAGLVVAQVASAWSAGRGPLRVSHERLAAFLVVAAWLGSELLPWVPSLDWQHVKDNLRPLLNGFSGLSILDATGAGLRTLVAGEALAVAFGPAGLLALLPLCGVLLAGKALVIGQTVGISVAVGVLAGAGVSLASQLLAPAPRRLTLILLLPAGMAALALLPLDPYAPHLAADWVPFAGLLRGDMLLNAQALAGRLFLYGGLLWLLRREGARLLPASVGLAVWLMLLELLQVVLPGQRADITEPLWALLCGWAWVLLPTASTVALARPPAHAAPPSQTAAPTRPQRTGPWACAWRALLLAVILTLALADLLRLPDLPYNVLELFRFNGALPSLFVFSLAVLWIGASSAWIGHALAAGRRPWRFFPTSVLLSALVSLGLLYASVTTESILDISGSNNLYHFVTQRDIWGPFFRELFHLIGPTAVQALERPVRYVALVGPLWFVLAFAVAFSRGLRGRDALYAFTAALPWLWLCKAIAFDGSSTDNLNELIARDGRWGLGGGGYLYCLLALLCASAALLAHRWRHWALAPVAWLLVAASVPLGWWLLTHGLEPRVQKYDRVFSGWQFLLGPDRDQRLSEAALFWRWTALHLSAVFALAVGAWTAAPLHQTIGIRHPPGSLAREGNQGTPGRHTA